ncbi:nuclear transport factor 2-like [Halichondria panicea]|uniref:nuclear transport factor 2-like n=1 Tax=Halichondria panicea TaxID=6063 RepID=UPI00312B3A27
MRNVSTVVIIKKRSKAQGGRVKGFSVCLVHGLLFQEMSSIEDIAQKLVTNYYAAFDTNRASLQGLYTPQSQLQFETNVFTGPDAILQKLTSLPFVTVNHAITTVDSQMTPDSGLLIMVVGQLKTDNDPVHPFTEVFYCKQIGDSLFITNQVFRLNLHHSAA